MEAVFARQEGREDRAGRRGAARQRDPAQVRGREQANVEVAASVEKRVVFRSAWLPYALVAPQIAITIVFFFWPAVQAGVVFVPAAGRVRRAHAVRRLRELRGALRRRATTCESFKITAFFSVLVAGAGIAISLLLAAMADRVIRGALAYRTLLIWPYAVAPGGRRRAVAFLFAPSIGIVTYVLRRIGIDWNWVLQRRPGDAAGRDRRDLEADQLQLPLLPRRPAVDPALADRGGGDRRRRPRRGASGPSSSRCSRRPRSSCWW